MYKHIKVSAKVIPCQDLSPPGPSGPHAAWAGTHRVIS